jgi:hypothetical protein
MMMTGKKEGSEEICSPGGVWSIRDSIVVAFVYGPSNRERSCDHDEKASDDHANNNDHKHIFG